MIKLTKDQAEGKCNFIKDYISASNAANGSSVDANANVSNKNLATMVAELHKDTNIQINRKIVSDKIRKIFDDDLAKEYIRQIEEHEIYIHDESSLFPYCSAVSMYPFLLNGLKDLGGESESPKHLSSFCGSYVNLIFALSSQFAGAVATVEALMYFDYFARKDYGDNYLNTDKYQIDNHLQHIIYAINQPAASRNYQSSFTNWSIFDENYFNSIFGEFRFPDMSKPNWESLNKLQRHFMKWFNKERSKSVLTFPVVTAAMLTDNGEPKDKEFADFISEELSEGNAFFIYMSDSADSLSSCCRLRNDVSDQLNDFSYSLGAGGVSTGSLNVITINMNRLFQQGRNLEEEIAKIHKYQVATRRIFEDYQKNGMLPVYDAGYIHMNRQYLTIGINGLVEGAEYLGFDVSNNSNYKVFLSTTLKTISDLNKKATKEYGYKFNTEYVPAENLGVKNAKWDKKSGLKTFRECYNSYFYKVEDFNTSILDKFALHGEEVVKYLDGGSALHANLEEYPTKEGFRKLLDVAAVNGCNYFCFNIMVTICNDCGFINKQTKHICTKCNSKNIDHATRVIGYLKKVSDFSTARQKEADQRAYSKVKKEVDSKWINLQHQNVLNAGVIT